MVFADKKGIGRVFIRNRKKVSVILHLYHNDFDYRSMISRKLDITLDNTFAILAQMTEIGLVNRKIILPNKKNVFYFLTKKGKRVARILELLEEYI